MDRELRSALIWYTPIAGNLEPRSAFLLDPTLSAALEVALGSGTPVATGTISRYLRRQPETNYSTCRAQIFAAPGTTDIRTADLMARFYQSIENGDWRFAEKCLVVNLQSKMADGILTSSFSSTRAEYLTKVKEWRKELSNVWFDITQTFITTMKALVEFHIWCDGKIIVSGLSQYQLEIVDDTPMIVSIFNHSRAVNPRISVLDDGTIDWAKSQSVLDDGTIDWAKSH